MNGNGKRPMGPMDRRLAEAMKQNDTGQELVSKNSLDALVEAFGGVLGRAILTLLQPVNVPCFCGKCQGVAYRFPKRVHFKPVTGIPELIDEPSSEAERAILKALQDAVALQRAQAQPLEIRHAEPEPVAEAPTPSQEPDPTPQG